MELTNDVLLERLKDPTHTINFGTRQSAVRRGDKSYFIYSTCIKTKETEFFILESKKEYDAYFAYYKNLPHIV